MKHMIVFDRLQHGFEKELRIISSHQYPSTIEQCEKYPMLVGHADMIHPGWLPVLSYWSTSIGYNYSHIYIWKCVYAYHHIYNINNILYIR